MKNLKFYFQKALKEGFAIGALNFNNMETLQAIESSCKINNSPMIIAVSESALSYMGDYCIALANTTRKNSRGIFLHLDHGKDFDICKKAIDMGFDSVMIDGSSLPFEENIAITKKVCEYAHKKGVLVEGELGQLKGIEDEINVKDNHYTDPNLAKEFVEKTNVDSLAIAIGTSHGAYKYTGAQTLRFDILEEIEKLLPNFPLVLHGASTVDENLIKNINANGGKIKNAIGINQEQIKLAIKKHNIVKINSDTDLRLAMTSGIRQILKTHLSEFDPRKYLGNGRSEIEKLVDKKITDLFYSYNKI